MTDPCWFPFEIKHVNMPADILGDITDQIWSWKYLINDATYFPEAVFTIQHCQGAVICDGSNGEAALLWQQVFVVAVLHPRVSLHHGWYWTHFRGHCLFIYFCFTKGPFLWTNNKVCYLPRAHSSGDRYMWEPPILKWTSRFQYVPLQNPHRALLEDWIWGWGPHPR